MNQVIDNNSTSLESFKQTARLLYLGHGITFLFSLGLLNLIPLIINYIKRPDTQGTIVYSHHTWMTRSFWIYIALVVVSFVLFVTIILIPVAWLLGIAAWLWYAYRLIKGFIDLNAGRPMP